MLFAELRHWIFDGRKVLTVSCTALTKKKFKTAYGGHGQNVFLKYGVPFCHEPAFTSDADRCAERYSVTWLCRVHFALTLLREECNEA
eukprot:446911-Rhodomonas_salina.3